MPFIESAGPMEYGSCSILTLSAFLEDDVGLVIVGKGGFIDIDSARFSKPSGLVGIGWFCSEDAPGSVVKS